MVPITTGFNLHKLGLLSDLATDVLERDMTVKEAQQRLFQIDSVPDPFGGFWWQFMAFGMVGAGLPILLHGTWWDVLVGTFVGWISFLHILLFEKVLPPQASVWLNLTSSFICAACGAFVKLLRPEVSVTIVTLSGIAIHIPGSMITLGISDLVDNHVISGAARFIKGAVTMMWLVLGYWLATELVDALSGQQGQVYMDAQAQPISEPWLALFIPILCVSVVIVFQISFRDIPWAILCMGFAYAASFVCGTFFERANLGTFLASVVMTIFANVWSRWFDRPNLIVLLPAFLMTVSGIVGFLGLTGILNQEEEGMDQFFQMFIVAGLVVAGILAGSTIVQPETTI